jgi:maltokinase
MNAEEATSVLEAIAEQLREWLPTQRWFAGKDRPVLAVRPVQVTTLLVGDPMLLDAVVAVDQGGPVDHYQLLIGCRAELPEQLRHAWIGGWDGGACYDAVHDTQLAGRLLDLIASDAQVGGLRFEQEPHADVKAGLRSRPVSAEQSNTSLVFGHDYILKLFRRLSPGPNPDLVLHRALHSVGCEHIAAPVGSVHGELHGEPVTFGMLQEFLAAAADGWAMATASVRDLMAEADLHASEVGGDFAGEAHRLGQAVAAVHSDLDRALGHDSAGPEQIAAAVDAMQHRLTSVRSDVPALAPYEAALRKAFAQARGAAGPILVQHVHGDLHLGQVLRTATNWVVIDFEGEPAAPAAERTALRSPLRDVASMLRSFDYAAHQQLVGQTSQAITHQQSVRALEWSQRNRDAFCDGYAEASRDTIGDPREQAALLRALELDKAVYEVSYEHKNRPEWLAIPLTSIARITAEEEQS